MNSSSLSLKDGVLMLMIERQRKYPPKLLQHWGQGNVALQLTLFYC